MTDQALDTNGQTPGQNPGQGADARPGDEGDLSIFRRVIPDLWPASRPDLRLRVVVALAFLVLAKAATVATPFVYKWAVDALVPQGDVTAALIVAPIGIVVAYGAVRVTGVLFQQLRDALFAHVSNHALRRLALRAFRHLHALSLGFHISRRTGSLSRIVDRGVKAIDFLLRFILFSIVPLMIELLLVAIVFWWVFGISYFLVVVGTVALYTVFTFKVTEWRVAIRKRMNERDQDASQKAIDSLLNFETVKYFTNERHEAERYDRAMRGYQKASVQTAQSLAMLNSGQALIITGALIAVMVMAARGVADGTLTVGDFVMANALMIQITVPLNFLGTVYREIRQALVDMREMFSLLDKNPDVQDRPGAQDLDVREGRVTFRDVDFGYGPDRQILHGVSFDVPPGGTLAVVGPSGAGKSTIARILFRFYEVSGGNVEIDGQDLRDVTQESLRSAIGVVPQDTVLFNDSIAYNIAYGRPGASREEVEAAARAARIHDFVSALPDGYDTIVGERGLKLSGGEKQRVAIARTILKNPPILILDEATSALDSQTEAEIQQELRALGRDRTVIVIAHRLSTVVDAGEIVVLDAGRVIERGTHAELVAAGGRYAAMWARQQEAEPV